MDTNKKIDFKKLIDLKDAYLMAGEAVQFYMPYTNKDFCPRTPEEATRKLKLLVSQEHLGEDWIRSIGDAWFNDCPMAIELDNEWTWNALWGAPGETQASFNKKVKKASESMKDGKMQIQDKFGKRYF